MASYELRTGETIYLDDDVAETLAGQAWRRSPSGSVYRNYRHRGKVKTESLAAVVTGESAPRGYVWAPVDGNWRNFRRENLEVKPRGWQLAEGREERLFVEGDIRPRETKPNPTGYRGVHKSGRKYKALATVNGKQTYLGLRDTPEEAARLYDQALIAQGLEPVNEPLLQAAKERA